MRADESSIDETLLRFLFLFVANLHFIERSTVVSTIWKVFPDSHFIFDGTFLRQKWSNLSSARLCEMPSEEEVTSL